MINKIKDGLFNLFFIFFISLILLVVLEFLVGFFITNETKYTGNEKVNPIYKNASWYEQYKNDYKNPGQRYFPYSVWVMNEYHSDSINYDKNGVRNTINIDNNSTKPFRVYMFGGSTTQCDEVIDKWTIASRISFHLSKIDAFKQRKVQVVNFGTSAYSNTQELYRLIYEAQRDFKDYGKPDLVIFYDGVNEVWAGTYLERPGYHDAYDRVALRYNDINKFYLLKIVEYLNSNFNLFKLINQFRDSSNEEMKYFASKPSRNFEILSYEQAMIYKKNISIANKLGEYFGFEIISFLQPQLFTLKTKNSDDLKLLEQISNNKPIMKEAYKIGYKVLRSKLSDDNISFDLINILNDKDIAFYKDFCHVGHEANDIIAKEISKIINSKQIIE